MTIQQLKHLIKLAKINGLQTLGDLASYKRENCIKSNGELFRSLYNASCRTQNIRQVS